MAQQPKPAPSSKPKLKRSPLQRIKSTTDPDSIEEQAAQGIGSDAENALGLYYDGLLGLTHGELWFVYVLWL